LDRIDMIKKDPLYLECLSLNSLREQERVFCRHDQEHLEAVARISLKIITEAVGLDRFARDQGLEGTTQAAGVIYAAGLLHDLGRWRQYDAGEDHAGAGARLARPVLERAGFAKQEIGLVTRAITEHRRAGPGASLLGRVICLADDLSRPCATCQARSECYKFDDLENLREQNKSGYRLDAG